jgi:hypothetical protein
MEIPKEADDLIAVVEESLANPVELIGSNIKSIFGPGGIWRMRVAKSKIKKKGGWIYKRCFYPPNNSGYKQTSGLKRLKVALNSRKDTVDIGAGRLPEPIGHIQEADEKEALSIIDLLSDELFSNKLLFELDDTSTPISEGKEHRTQTRTRTPTLPLTPTHRVCTGRKRKQGRVG